MNFGLIIIGDEILSGKRADKHLPKVIELLGERGLALTWARYVGDDPGRITADLKDAFAEQLDHLGQVLVGALAREDLVADDEKSDVHAAKPRGGSSGNPAWSTVGPAPLAAASPSSRRSRCRAARR